MTEGVWRTLPALARQATCSMHLDDLLDFIHSGNSVKVQLKGLCYSSVEKL